MTVTPRFKEQIDCACGTEGCSGVPRRKAYRDGVHVRSCECRLCKNSQRGLAAHRDGHRRQAKASRALGLQGLTNEEREASIFANEVKSGKQTGPAWTWWVRAEAQIIGNEADHGSRRKPARVILKPDDRDGLVMVRESTWAEFITPALLAFYGEA
jgi:hypothetical protein